MRTTLKDVAQAVGVSIITVSKVMRGHTDIGEQTRERVLQKAKDLNFRPNLAARSLVTGRSSLVGLVVPDLLHPYFVEISKALASSLRKKDYYLMIASSEEDPNVEAREIEHLLALRLDALIVASCASVLPDLFLNIQKQDMPLILLDRTFEGFRSNFVGSDNVEIGRIATEHLISLGRRKVAHIRGPESSIGRGRFEGYVHALNERRIPFRQEYVVGTQTVDVDSTVQGRNAMRQLLSCRFPPDGIFCYSDPLAIGAMDAIIEAGLRIPEDVAIVGCGNLHYDDHLRVPLTSVDQNSTALGTRAAKMLMSLLESKSKKPALRLFTEPAKLVLRGSTRP